MGKQTHPDGRVYEGEYRDGKPQGQGKETSPDGHVYEGEWHDGERHGRGKVTWPGGHVYEGEWHERKPHGRGVLDMPDGECHAMAFDRGRLVSGDVEAARRVGLAESLRREREPDPDR